MKYHEYANMFPMMQESEMIRLAEDIKENGLSDPIVTCNGMILDGRNRHKACEFNNITPAYIEYDGDDPLAYVISHNLHRRHLTESQRAMVGAKWAALKHGSNQNVRKSESPISDSSKPTVNATRDEAGKLLNISRSSIDRAKKVIKLAPELVDKIESGEMSVNAAYITTKKQMEEASQEPEPLVVDGTKEPMEEPIDEPKAERVKQWTPDDARRLWTLAKTDLDKILKEDKSRVAVLLDVIKYAQNRMDKNK